MSVNKDNRGARTRIAAACVLSVGTVVAVGQQLCAPISALLQSNMTHQNYDRNRFCVTSQLDTATRALAGAFRRQRPLGGSSLIITIFGDAIAPKGGVISLSSLIQLCGLFGVTERLVRTSAARLVESGWLGARRHGRRSEYHLSLRGLRRFADATRRIYSAGPDNWNAVWTFAVLPTNDSDIRESLRKELSWLGFGQPMPGLMIHPTRSAADTVEQISSVRGASQVRIFEARNHNVGADELFARDSWDLRDRKSVV